MWWVAAWILQLDFSMNPGSPSTSRGTVDFNCIPVALSAGIPTSYSCGQDEMKIRVNR